MSLNRENVLYILARFDAGIPPLQILNELQYRAYLPWINITTVERCLYENGRLQEIPAPSWSSWSWSSSVPSSSLSLPLSSSTTAALANNQGWPDPSSTSTHHHQHQNRQKIPKSSPTTAAAAAAVVGKVGTVDNNNNPEDPGPTMSWDSQADRFTFSAYRCGKSEDDIWVTLRNNGYDITRPQVVASLIEQGFSAAR